MEKETETAIRELAEKLGTTVEHLWGVLTQQAAVNAASMLVQMLMMLLVIASLMYVTFKAAKADPAKHWLSVLTDGDEDERKGCVFFFVLLSLVCATIVIVTSIAWVNEIITCLSNPEYWALQQILDKL